MITTDCSQCGVKMWWCIGRVEAFRPKGRGCESRSSRHVGTLSKSLTRSYLWRFGVKLPHSIRAVSGALLSGGGLEEALLNELTIVTTIITIHYYHYTYDSDIILYILCICVQIE